VPSITQLIKLKVKQRRAAMNNQLDAGHSAGNSAKDKQHTAGKLLGRIKLASVVDIERGILEVKHAAFNDLPDSGIKVAIIRRHHVDTNVFAD